MLAVPEVEAVNVEEHVADAVVPDKVHVVKVPETPLTVRPTVPVGVVGLAEISVTVTVQVEPWLITTGVVQLMVVVVVWPAGGLTVTLVVPLLPL